MSDNKIYVDFTISSYDKTTNVAFHVDEQSVWQEVLSPIIETFEGHWGNVVDISEHSATTGDSVGIYYPGKYDER
jgi:hypothetical protein